MYYHCRDLKYVVYGKVYPPPFYDEDHDFKNCYAWLGKYCGYFPQIWLSRSHVSITGYKRGFYWVTKQKIREKDGKKIYTNNKVKFRKRDSVLFGFDIVPGAFPVDYNLWENVMMALMDSNSFEEQNVAIEKMLNDYITWHKEAEEEEGKEIPMDNDLKKWLDCERNLGVYLNRYLFVEKDQVVVPSLNLKCAKKIICRDEKQKKKLRHMGFIEDRIEIKNLKSPRW